MSVFVALLRAVNVGGTGKLPMAELRSLCDQAGFEDVVTYIQSGNVVFTSKLSAASVKKKLEAALTKHMKKPAAVHVRTDEELAKLLAHNPFPRAPKNRVYVHFLDRALPKRALDDLRIPGNEEVVPEGREVFVHYPDGMGRSKLRLPFTAESTARNLNTVQKLADLARR